uniref:Uncharacterized protein n=1 Tax=Magallana gigas TaxID=29159 RepID=A0A8W8KII8_MAGGI
MHKLSLKKYTFGKMESQDDDHMTSRAIRNSFETALTSRDSIACAREGLSYAIMSGKLPPYMRWHLECRPNLGDESINKEFQEIWKTKTNTIRDKILKSSVDFMDDKIGLANNKLREIRGETLSAIGKSTQAAGAAKSKFNEKTRQLKEEFDRKLLDFKVNIRSERKSTINQHSRRPYTAQGKEREKRTKIPSILNMCSYKANELCEKFNSSNNHYCILKQTLLSFIMWFIIVLQH